MSALFDPEINFAEAQPPLRGKLFVVGWALLAASLVALIALVGLQVVVVQRMDTTKDEISKLQYGAQATERISAGVSKEALAEFEAVDRAAKGLAIPWAALFQALEASKTDRVVLLSMQPSAQQGDVRIVGEADEFAAVTEFVTALGAQPGFTAVHLAAHEMRGPSRLQFEVAATWMQR